MGKGYVFLSSNVYINMGARKSQELEIAPTRGEGSQKNLALKRKG